MIIYRRYVKALESLVLNVTFLGFSSFRFLALIFFCHKIVVRVRGPGTK